ncbi:dehydrogenase [Photobacterium kishitanii]|uniref:zinc-binding dehydrogenase n=1 Tax=Photobacterium kishitanii TaxID=318456 RepID=UPI00071AEDA4|nr:zinc-binding dehydrogenase [Photobacterium kishitanii]OBU28699.1 dehydrogenase [Photobacterium kishitanii]PSU92598.1 dehydrogenase [Photobacterium kishitanii]PSW70291.1 dehydrogenase [Photobacterium kishitanii]
MQAWILQQPDGLQALSLMTTAKPVPAADEICVKVAAVGLNPIDYKLTEWGYATWDYPQIIGLDVAGSIDSVGTNVHQFKINERVIFFADPRTASGFAEYVCVKAIAVSRIPLTLSFTDAAALPCAGYSAWVAVHDKLQVVAGQHIAITGAGGGVGGFAAQLAKLAGAHVYAIAERQHHPRLLSYGIDAVICPQQNVALELINLTEDRLLHGVIDCISAQSGSMMSALVRYNGHIVMVANQFDQVPLLATTKALSIHEVALHGTYAHGGPEHITHLADIGNNLSNLVADGRLYSMIEKIVPFEKLDLALTELKNQTHSGKIVVHISK